MIELDINAELDGTRIYISEWDNGGAWIRLGSRSGSMYVSVTRSQAQELMETLQTILAKEVTA
jgi:uncharacterized protein (DUF736 family)